MEKSNTRYWLTVVSKDHLMRGVTEGFMQANHGKPGPLKKMKEGDKVVFYSPKVSYEGTEKCQAFTAAGTIADDDIYQVKMTDTFTPYRRNVDFKKVVDAPIQPLIEQLSFIKNKQSWGYTFRFGFFEINQADYQLIMDSMRV